METGIINKLQNNKNKGYYMTELMLVIKVALAVATPLGGLIWYIINTWDKKTERLMDRVDELEEADKNKSVEIQALKTGKVSYDDLNKAIFDLSKTMSEQFKDLSAEIKNDRNDERQEHREDMREMKELIMMSRRKDGS